MPECTILRSYDVKQESGRIAVDVVFPDSATNAAFQRLVSMLEAAFPSCRVTIVKPLDPSWYQYAGKFTVSSISAPDIRCLESLLGLMHGHLTIFDALDESYALAPYQLWVGSDNEGNEKLDNTMIGDIVYRAKYKDDQKARAQIQMLMIEFIQAHPSYRNADVLCAVPASDTSRTSHLPTHLGERIAVALGKQCVPVCKVRKTQQQKDIEDERQKKINVEDSMKVVSSLHGKTVIALDDFYESGRSMEEMARACRAAGAARLLGLAVVKNRKGLKKLRAEDYADRWIVK